MSPVQRVILKRAPVGLPEAWTFDQETSAGVQRLCIVPVRDIAHRPVAWEVWVEEGNTRRLAGPGASGYSTLRRVRDHIVAVAVDYANGHEVRW